MKIVLLIAVFWGTAESVRADVRVAERLRYGLLEESRKLEAKQYISHPFQLEVRDKIELRVDIRNKKFSDLNVYICPTDQVAAFINRQYTNCYGIQKGTRSVSFSYEIPVTGPYSIVLDNSYASFVAKTYELTVSLTTTIPSEQRAMLLKMLSGFKAGIQYGFQVPSFGLSLVPCGFENAFSAYNDGSIKICSELFLRLVREKRTGAFMGILFHELGHSLLNLWNMPGWDNEQTVDEFAVYMFYQVGKQEMAFDLASYFSEFNSEAEASRILYQDTRHPISIQRARNILRILKNPQETVKRWNNLVYPHLTEAGLRDIVDNPGLYGDRALANSILARR